MGHYEVAPYFLKDEHTRVPELQLASEAAMEKLAELDERFPDIIRTCGKESALTERRLWAEREASAEKHMREWGVEVTTLSAAEKARFRAQSSLCTRFLRSRAASSSASAKPEKCKRYYIVFISLGSVLNKLHYDLWELHKSVSHIFLKTGHFS